MTRNILFLLGVAVVGTICCYEITSRDEEYQELKAVADWEARNAVYKHGDYYVIPIDNNAGYRITQCYNCQSIYYDLTGPKPNPFPELAPYMIDK